MLSRAYVRGWPDSFDDDSAGDLRVVLEVTSRSMTYFLQVLAFLLALLFFSCLLLVVADVGRSWYTPARPVMAVLSLLGLASLEISSPGHRIPVLLGFLAAPFLTVVWYGVLRYRHGLPSATTPPASTEPAAAGQPTSSEGGEAQ